MQKSNLNDTDRYQRAIDYLYNCLPMFSSLGAGAYKPGLGNAIALSGAFGNPHLGLRCIHIAGTNGKGSTSHTIASVLSEAGYKVGLYTSPHIFDFGERIRINGQKISHDYVADFVEKYQLMSLDCSPSFFELTTIMAFEYFRSMNVDIAVIETGLGGRLDTTNIITPMVSVITNVSMDHTAQLGDTIQQIAAEKAGIIKPGVPVVIGHAQLPERSVFSDTAQRLGAPITFVDDLKWPVETTQAGDLLFAWCQDAAPDIVSDLKGNFQRENIPTALAALRTIGIANEDFIRRGVASVVANTHLIGRWQTLKPQGPQIICDTGHNIGAWQHLAPALQAIAAKSALRIVIGFVADKDIIPIFDLLPAKASYYFVSPPTHRARPASDLMALAQERGLDGKAFDSVDDGYKQALADSQGSGTIFIGGSNYVVAALSDYAC